MKNIAINTQKQYNYYLQTLQLLVTNNTIITDKQYDYYRQTVQSVMNNNTIGTDKQYKLQITIITDKQ